MSSNINCCGSLCWECDCHKAECQGCHNSAGQPHWLAGLGLAVCPLYKCAVTDRSMKNCGQCRELPCDKFLGHKAPALSDKEFKHGVADRVSLLRGLYFS